MNAPVTEESSIMKAEAEQRERKARYDAAQQEKAKEKEKISDSDDPTVDENNRLRGRITGIKKIKFWSKKMARFSEEENSVALQQRELRVLIIKILIY